jgi:ParB family chromosome partitioning protein
MATVLKSLTYRGDVKAAVGVGNTLVFVTVHPENLPTGVYRLDAEKLTLAVDALPVGGVAVVVDDKTLWVAGSDNRVYQASAGGGAPVARGPQLEATPVALALLSNDRLGVLAGKQVAVLARADGTVLQTLDLPDAGTSLAADATGQWLVAGTSRGTVTVFDGESKPQFLVSESERLHQGAVTALLFEQEELRFFSAGADQKLLSTHARGKLEPEDRGRGNTHKDQVTALVWGPGERFYSGSRDKTIKAWPRTGAAKPTTFKDGVGKVTGLAVVHIHKRPHLVAACDDNTFRFFVLDPSGKLGEPTHKVQDAYALARYEFTQDESRRREAALTALASYNDTASVEMLSERIGEDSDHGVRLLATRLLGEAKHLRAAPLLEKWLNFSDEAVRVAALEGLRKQLGEQDLRPLDLALKVEKADVGRVAVQALESLAKNDDQALARLTEALNAKTLEVRQQALAGLEKVHDSQSPEANLLALNSKHGDLRRLTLIRLFQRGMLQHAKVQSALRWRTEDKEAEVRRAAFLISLFTREKLVGALRVRDPELHRQLHELETFSLDAAADKAADTEHAEEAEPTPGRARKSRKAPPPPPDLEEADFNPLLQATASRALDTCLRGARGLAVLGDPRAFGLLLQLSREENTQARAEVCRALGVLEDPRSIKRLRGFLHDREPEVRDAAFTALVHIHQGEPLLAAESGLNAGYEDVRRRGLQVLIGAVRKAPPRQADEPAWQLLVRALNDSFEGVRGEAFKAVLNLQLAGGGIHTLRFVLQSVHADVRREVLTEAMAQVGEPWAWNLLVEFYNDHDPQLRQEAFAFAVKKNKELEPLEAGLRSSYADVRKQAVAGLIKKHTAAAQALLVRALTDPEKEVRQLALDALVSADAEAALTQALDSQHPDVRVRAAKALARHGAAAAFAPLLALATAPEPQEQERLPPWEDLATQALAGLAQLGDPAALPHLVPLLDSKHAAVRKNVAFALMWVSPPHSPEPLRQALQHADEDVKYHAALGLAFAGDPLVASLVFSDAAAKVLTPEERLVAALTLGPAGEDQLVVFLDDADEKRRTQALLLLLLREMKGHAGTPARCLACLSSRMPRVRLTAARALESFADPAAFLQFVVQQFNDRGDEQAWKFSADTVATVAELVVHGQPHTRARTAQLLRYLGEKEQAAWDQAWVVHARRFAGEIAALRQQAPQRQPPPSQYSAAQLQELAFGGYVGLVREQGSATARGSRTSGLGAQAVMRVRQTALSRILALASANPHYARAAQPVFVQALGDPNQAVRMQAFEQLQTLGMDSAALGAEALEAGHTDLGVKGLEVLTSQTSAAEGQAVLEQVMLSRNDELAVEAARLLAARKGTAAVAGRALEAVYEALRTQAVAWLAAEYDKDGAAQESLRQALHSRYQKVRHSATFELATKKDALAFDALLRLLNNPQEANRQKRVIQALVTLGDPRAPDALLDRLENDPAGSAAADDLLRAAGTFRRPENADRLLGLMEKNAKWRGGAFNAVLAISGYDQNIADAEDEQPDHSWEAKQFPRHDAVLARLLDRCFTLNETRSLLRLLPGARWARGKEVEPVLALLTTHADDKVRQGAVEALGWRLRKRKGSAEPLLKLLQHRDPVTQFLAAEGLARAGRAEGLNVLLAAVDFMTDFGLRQRAVSALGELADARGLDVLLRLAGEDGHALQEAAAEAIGHLGKSEKAEDIYKLLERFARGRGGVAENALKGLRWLDTHAGWQLIRRRAMDPTFEYRSTAVDLLGYNDDPATRDLLLRLLAGDDDWSGVWPALTSARRLWGEQSLEPDYALLQNRVYDAEEELEESLKRVCERGDSRRLFEVLPRGREEVQEVLGTTLLNRPALPVAEARAALGSADERTAQVAARVLGRAGPKEAGAGPDLAAALHRWREVWEERCQKMFQEGEIDERLIEKVTPLCAGHGVGGRPAGRCSGGTDRGGRRPARRLPVSANSAGGGFGPGAGADDGGGAGSAGGGSAGQ